MSWSDLLRNKVLGSALRRRTYAYLRHRLTWILICVLVFSLFPWNLPVLTPRVGQALDAAPDALGWSTPLALSITGWADRALSSVGPQSVYAGANITLTLTKRDEGNLHPLVPAGPDPLLPGSDLIYYIYVTNTGSITASVRLTETLPEGLTCSDAWRVSGYDGGADWWLDTCSGRQVSLYTLDAVDDFIFDGLGPGQQAVLYVQASMAWPMEDGRVFTNTRSSYVAVADQEPVYLYTGTDVVTTVVHAPRLAIAKTVEPGTVEAGAEVTYTLAVSNSGHYPFTAPFTLTVVDRFPDHTQYARHSQFTASSTADVGVDAVTWTVPFSADWNPGEMVTATLVMTVDRPLQHDLSLSNNDYSVSIEPAELVTPAQVSGAAVEAQVVSRPSLSLAKGDAPDPVYADQSWTYWITVSNAADAQGDAVGLVITDRVPVSTVLQSTSYQVPGTSVETEGTAAPSLITWTLPADYSLLWGESTTVSFTVRSSSLMVVSPTVITNTSYGVIASNADAPVNGVPVTTTLWSEPRLSISKIGPGVDTVRPGQQVSYTIVVTNTGTGMAYGVQITDAVPANTQFVAASDGGVESGGIVEWTLDIPTMDVGYHRVMTVELDTPLDNGTVIDNSAWVSYSVGLTESNAVLLTVVSSPTLHITKTALPADTVGIGDLLTYTIIYSNSGDMTATGVVISDVVDPNLSVQTTDPAYDGWSAGVLTWSGGSLPPDDPRTITVVARVASTLPDGAEVFNLALINHDQGLAIDTGSVTVTVQAANLEVSKAHTPDEVGVGELVTYHLVLTNTGQVAASDVQITDALPVSVTLVSSDTVGVTYDGHTGSVYRWTAASMAADAVAQITITARVTTTGGWMTADGIELTNIVTVSSPTDNSPGDDVDQASFTATPGPASVLTVTVSPATEQVGTAVDVTIQVADAYGNPAYNGDGYQAALSGSSGDLNLGTSPVGILDGQGATTASSNVIGTYDVTATVTALPAVSDTTQVTFTAGAVAGFVIGNISTQNAGISFTVDITAVDTYGNVVDWFDGTVGLADDVAPNTLSPATTAPFVDGVLSGQQVTITLARADTAILVGTGVTQTDSNLFDVVAGVPVTLAVQASASEIPLGVDAPVTATVRDAYDNLVAGAALTYSIDLGATTPGTGTTGPDGWAGFTISSVVLGPATVVVTASNGVTGSVPVTFVAGVPAAITVTIVPSYTAVGSTATITVQVRDAYGNDVTWGSVSLDTDQGLGLGEIAPSGPIALDNQGLATATISSTVLGAKVVEATANANGYAASGTVTFTVGAPHNLVVAMSPNPQVVGVDATLYATMTDRYGNAIGGQDVSFAADAGALGGGGIEPATATTDGQGVATAAISSTVIGGYAVTATAVADATVFGTTAAFFVAGDPATVTLSVAPNSVEGGVNAALTMTVTDQYGNFCAGQPVTLTSGPLGLGGIAPSIPVADESGVAMASISGTLAGQVTITATAAPAVSDSTVLTITSGLLDHLLVSPVPDPLVAGVDVTLVITAVDANDVQRSDDGTVSIQDGTGTISPASVAMVDGVATVVISITQAMIDDQITLTWSTDAAVTGSTNLFTVTAGDPAAVTVTANPSSISPDGDTSTLVATVVDAYDNPIAGRTVDWAQASGPVVTLSPNSGTSDAGGQVTITLTSGSDQGTATIEAMCEGVTGSVDVQISTYIVYLPLVLRNYTGIDLLPVGTIRVVPSGDGTSEIEVTIENAGPGTLTADFWVDLYIDPTGPVGLNVLWNDVCTYGKAWFVREDLAPGEQITLRTSDPDDPASPGDRYSNWPGTFDGAGPHELWVMVDSYGVPNIGAVIEADEDNNLVGPVVHTASAVMTGGTRPVQPLDVRPTPVP